MPETLAAHYAPGLRRGWLGFFGGFAAAGLGLVIAGLWFAMLPLWLVGVPMLGVFGGLGVLAWRRLSDPRPVIRVGPDGYHDRRLGVPIPWAEITALRRHQPGRRLILLIAVAAPERFLGHAGLLKRPMLKLNPRLGFPAIGSRLDGLDLGQDRLADAAEGWWAMRQG